MNIAAVGIGKIGRVIIEHLCKEGHNVVAIDSNPRVLDEVVNEYDIKGICGNGASYDIQLEAGMKNMDLLIATTNSDEVNLLVCIVAKKLGVENTIARVRNPEYAEQVYLMKEELGLSMAVNPEHAAANEIVKMINFPSALKVDTFGKGKVDLMEILVDDDSPLIGEKLNEIREKYQVQVLVCAVQRQDQILIPSGNFVIQAKDKIHITASRDMIVSFLRSVGLLKDRYKDVMVIGGGKISFYLCKELIKNHCNVKIIDNDASRCELLSEALPKAVIINGDGTNQELLLDEGLESVDVCVALTGIDEENIVISMFAQKYNIGKVIMKINRNNLIGIAESIGIATVISQKNVTASQIMSYVRAKSNKRGSNVKTLYKLVNNQVEALEFLVKEKSHIVNIPIKNLKIKDKILIAGIIRSGVVIIPNGNDTVQVNDSVLVVTTNQFLDDLDDILE